MQLDVSYLLLRRMARIDAQLSQLHDAQAQRSISFLVNFPLGDFGTYSYVE